MNLLFFCLSTHKRRIFIYMYIQFNETQIQLPDWNSRHNKTVQWVLPPVSCWCLNQAAASIVSKVARCSSAASQEALASDQERGELTNRKQLPVYGFNLYPDGQVRSATDWSRLTINIIWGDRRMQIPNLWRVQSQATTCNRLGQDWVMLPNLFGKVLGVHRACRNFTIWYHDNGLIWLVIHDIRVYERRQKYWVEWGRREAKYSHQSTRLSLCIEHGHSYIVLSDDN